MSARLTIRQVIRELDSGQEEHLNFEPGVNVLVGRPNTGKTKWLEIIDYVFGSSSRVEEKLGDDLAGKYRAARVLVEIRGEEFVFTRRWKEQGTRTKVFVGDDPYTLHEFQSFLMGRLGIPEVSFPQGSPYGSRTWPTLRYRSLLRHIYRRQLLWSDFADKQHDSEVYACVAQFVGIASDLFSVSYADMVAKEKRISELESRRVSYVALLTEVSRDVVGEAMEGVSVTHAGLASAVERISAEVEGLSARREQALRAALSGGKEAGAGPGQTEQHTARLVELRALDQEVEERLAANRRRREEIDRFGALAGDELARLQRAQQAGAELSPIRVTHCPLCSQGVPDEAPTDHSCRVCHQAVPPPDAGGEHRVAFEVEQLEAELGEARAISASLDADDAELERRRWSIREEIVTVDLELRPARQAITALVPAEVLLVDAEIGKRHAEIQQLRRVEASLAKREDLAGTIQEIRREVGVLKAEVDQAAARIDFEAPADHLADGMNEYVHSLRLNDEPAWTNRDDIAITLTDRTFKARIGHSRWRASVGGTLSLYFLLSYHYALMKLAAMEHCNYPGYCILDLPAELEGANVADNENFVIEPFVRLLAGEGFVGSQLIIAGSAFDGLEGATRIELDEVWG